VQGVLWYDKFWVTMLTTMHEGDETVFKSRKKPRDAAPASKVAQVFGTAARRELKISKVADDYNAFKSQVDVADQLRSYSTSLTSSVRNWFPFYIFILEVVLCNSFALMRLVCPNTHHDHTSFRMALVERLLERADH